jgi:hypothetical protein
MVKMEARYGQFNTEELRGAVEAISRPEAHSPMESPVFSAGIGGGNEGRQI